jgi:branched-chain amino acid transport system substrate-binding protein
VGALALTLVAAACGSSGKNNAGTTASSTTAGGAASTTVAVNGATSSTTPAATPTSMDQWEALWKTQRAAVVKRIKDNKWGKSADGSKLTGPEGFSVDLTKCPAGWNDTEGLTDTSIKIGYPLPQSGVNAESGGLGKAQDALMKYYGDKGAFTDVNGKTRKVNLVLRDDAYDPTRTIPLVDELIDSEKVFLIETAGTAPTLKTYDKLNQRCIPMPLPASGHPAVGDPVNHPWTTSSSVSYTTEAVMWGAFIEQHLAEFGGKARVSALKINNDFGTTYDNGFKAYLSASDHKADITYTSETVEPTAATITEQMTTIAAQKPQVFISMTVGTQCSQSITESAQNGMKEQVKYKFLGSACKASGPVTKDKVGDASDGWWSVGGGIKDIVSAAYDSDPWIVEARKFMAAAGYDYKSPIYNLGMYYSWALAQGFQIAGQLDGGLSRSNLILALRSMDMTSPMTLPGIKFNMNGNADAYFLEGSDISRWDATKQAWEQQSIVDLSGQTKPCAYSQSTGRCG